MDHNLIRHDTDVSTGYGIFKELTGNIADIDVVKGLHSHDADDTHTR